MRDARERLIEIIEEAHAYVAKSIRREPITYKLSPYIKATDSAVDAILGEFVTIPKKGEYLIYDKRQMPLIPLKDAPLYCMTAGSHSGADIKLKPEYKDEQVCEDKSQ